MSIFKTHPNLLQTRSLCFILRTYTISRDCIKKFFSKIVFSIEKTFSKKNIFSENFEKSENFPIFKSLIFQFFEIFIFRKCSFFFSKKSEKIFFRKNIFDRKNIFSFLFLMIFFKDKLFVKPRSFRMLAVVAHQIVTGGLILEPRGRRGAPSKNGQKPENRRKWEALGAP